MAMGHVMLKETWVERPVARFRDYAKRFTDLPLLVALEERDGVHVPGRFLLASDLGERSENADWKPIVLDAVTDAPAVPNGAVGFRYGEEGKGRWNLQLGDIDPVLSLHGRGEAVEVQLPRFDIGGPGGATMRRGVPTARVAGRLVTTVLDLMLATYGVARVELDEQRQVGEPLGVVGEAGDGPIDPELLEHHVAHRHRQRGVRARLRRQPLVGELDVVAVVRGDDHDLLAAVARLGHEVSVRALEPSATRRGQTL